MWPWFGVLHAQSVLRAVTPTHCATRPTRNSTRRLLGPSSFFPRTGASSSRQLRVLNASFCCGSLATTVFTCETTRTPSCPNFTVVTASSKLWVVCSKFAKPRSRELLLRFFVCFTFHVLGCFIQSAQALSARNIFCGHEQRVCAGRPRCSSACV